MTQRPRRLPRRVPFALGVLLLLLVVALAWAALAGLKARTGLQAVRTDLTALRSNPPDRVALLQRLDRDLALTRSAANLLGQPGPVVVAHLPVVGRSIQAERTIAEAGAAVISATRDSAAAAEGLGSAGQVDLGRLAVVHDVVARAAARTTRPLDQLAHLDTGWTPGFVSDAVRQAQQQLLGADVRLDHAASITAAAHDLLGGNGPRTIFIGLENNAELRGTGGLVSSFAIAHTSNGRLDIGHFRDIESLAAAPAHAQAVPAPADYTRTYGPFLANTTIWRNATMSADVPASAQVMAELTAATLKVTPDAVLLLDVPGMARLVSVTGPLRLADGSTVSGSKLVEALLVKAYGDGTLDLAQQEGRRHDLELAASRSFAAMASHPADTAMLEALSAAVDGRHLVLWSSHAQTQAQLVASGLAGSVDPGADDIAMATLNNLGDSRGFGNKLDYYMERSLAVSVVVSEGSAEVTQVLTIADHAPSGLGPYVEGTVHPGRMHELVQLAAARDATLESFQRNGRDVGVQVYDESGSQRVGLVDDLRPGQQDRFTLRYTVPVRAGSYTVHLLPQPLAHPASMTLDVKAATGQRLGLATGATLDGGKVHVSGPWKDVSTVTVRLHRPDLFQRVRHSIAHFWGHEVL